MPESPGPSPDPVAHRTPTKMNKIKKPPTITPRRFKKLFTPLSKKTKKPENPRPILRRLHSASVRRNGKATDVDKGMDTTQLIRTPRKRKRVEDEENEELSIPGPSTPDDVSEPFVFPSSQDYCHSSRMPSPESSEAEDDVDDDEGALHEYKKTPPIKRYENRNLSAGILSMSLSGRRRNRRVVSSSHIDWQHEAAGFYSEATDYHNCAPNQRYALPFSTAACNSKSACS